MKTRKWLVTATCVAALVAGAAGYFAAVRSYYRGVVPASGATLQLVNQTVPLSGCRRLEDAGSVYYLATGPMPPGYVLASGPPVYIFDARGRLVEWIQDGGDQSAAMRTWQALPSQEVTLDQAARNVAEPGDREPQPGP
jgi:hypothetical protein